MTMQRTTTAGTTTGTTINATSAPLLYQTGEGKQIKLKNVTITHKALGMETADAWGLLEYEAPPHFAGPPLHWHDALEAFYVLDGAVTFRLGSRTFTAKAGAFVLVPPGALHTFANQQATAARFLFLVSPAEFANYWAELAEGSNPTTDWRPVDQKGLAALSALEQKYGIYRLTGSPIPQRLL